MRKIFLLIFLIVLIAGCSEDKRPLMKSFNQLEDYTKPPRNYVEVQGVLDPWYWEDEKKTVDNVISDGLGYRVVFAPDGTNQTFMPGDRLRIYGILSKSRTAKVFIMKPVEPITIVD
jgi:hypothetical protein